MCEVESGYFSHARFGGLVYSMAKDVTLVAVRLWMMLWAVCMMPVFPLLSLPVMVTAWVVNTRNTDVPATGQVAFTC
jgi:hypothetical protein